MCAPLMACGDLLLREALDRYRLQSEGTQDRQPWFGMQTEHEREVRCSYKPTCVRVLWAETRRECCDLACWLNWGEFP